MQGCELFSLEQLNNEDNIKLISPMVWKCNEECIAYDNIFALCNILCVKHSKLSNSHTNLNPLSHDAV